MEKLCGNVIRIKQEERCGIFALEKIFIVKETSITYLL